jgi:AGZA family xanthine/uracil permease-like MFS transporter
VRFKPRLLLLLLFIDCRVNHSVAVGTIQCVQMAHEAGDRYSVRDSMIGDGVGTLIAAITGSPLGMTVFIGHPGFKRMGARTGYSLASAFVFWFLCVFGLLAPLNEMIVAAAVNPILVAIGLDITTETIKITPHRHIPAVILGLFPSMANWAQPVYARVNSLIAPGDELQSGTAGVNNLGNGALLVSMFITAIFIHGIDRNFRSAAIWCVVAAVLSFFGLIHSAEVGWLVKQDDISWRFAIAYLMVATMAVIATMLQRRGSIEPIRPEAIAEQIALEKSELEMQANGQTQQPNFCCACI